MFLFDVKRKISNEVKLGSNRIPSEGFALYIGMALLHDKWLHLLSRGAVAYEQLCKCNKRPSMDYVLLQVDCHKVSPLNSAAPLTLLSSP